MPDPRASALVGALAAPPERWWRAPGRVNLIGDHTDYNDGLVLPMAIDLDCVVAARATRDGRVRAHSLEATGTVDVAVDGGDDPRAVEPRWGRFVAGVCAEIAARGGRLAGAELAASSTVPVGSGLSSSSALAVALTLALCDLAGLELATVEVARAVLAGEIRATGVPGGLMDQLTALLGQAGHALLIDCRALAVEPIPLPPSVSVVVVHSGMGRTLAGSAYAERRAECEAIAGRLGVASLRDATPSQVADEPRARHVVSENARVLAMVEAMHADDAMAMGRLLCESHASLRDDYGVSTHELDLLTEMLVEEGALGARLTGAGFGGCVVAFAPAGRAQTVGDAAAERYRARTSHEPLVVVPRAVDGAGPWVP